MPRIELPGGAWAETAPVITHRITNTVETLYRRARRAAMKEEDLPDLETEMILAMVASWSLGELSESAVLEAPAEIVDPLFAAVTKDYGERRVTKESVPQA